MSTPGSCSLRLHVYASLLRNRSESIRTLAPLYAAPGHNSTRNSTHTSTDCLTGQCAYELFSGSRVYSSEVPLFDELLRRCPLEDDPAEADLFIVPIMFGTLQSSSWGTVRDKEPERYETWRAAAGGAFTADAYAQLSHLTPATAARHVFFWTADSDFVCHNNKIGVPRSLQKPLAAAIWVHLGDDHWRSLASMRQRRTPIAGDRYMPRDIVVPYRVSHWLPLGFPPRLPAEQLHHQPQSPSPPSTLLLHANVNARRHPSRGRFLSDLARAAARRGVSGRILLPGTSRERVRGKTGGMTADVRQASAQAMGSDFCLCPTGDAKGHTARLYHSIVHGCIPVRVDGWERNYSIPASGNYTNRSFDADFSSPRTEPSPSVTSKARSRADKARDRQRHRLRSETVALPFPTAIEWERVVIDAAPHDAGALLDRLLAMPASEVRARKAYLRRIAPLLLVDVRVGDQPNGADAFLAELHRVAGKHQGAATAYVERV